MKNVSKIEEQIEALKNQLSKAKNAERKAAKASARRDVQKALRKSGLLSLVVGGTMTTEQLAKEFKAIADRSSEKRSRSVTTNEPQSASVAADSPVTTNEQRAGAATAEQTSTKRSIWNR